MSNDIQGVVTLFQLFHRGQHQQFCLIHNTWSLMLCVMAKYLQQCFSQHLMFCCVSTLDCRNTWCLCFLFFHLFWLLPYTVMFVVCALLCDLTTFLLVTLVSSNTLVMLFCDWYILTLNAKFNRYVPTCYRKRNQYPNHTSCFVALYFGFCCFIFIILYGPVWYANSIQSFILLDKVF